MRPIKYSEHSLVLFRTFEEKIYCSDIIVGQWMLIGSRCWGLLTSWCLRGRRVHLSRIARKSREERRRGRLWWWWWWNVGLRGRRWNGWSCAGRNHREATVGVGVWNRRWQCRWRDSRHSHYWNGTHRRSHGVVDVTSGGGSYLYLGLHCVQPLIEAASCNSFGWCDGQW